MVIRLHKSRQLIRLTGEGTHHAGTHVVFAGQQGHTVHAVLGLMVDGHGQTHNAPDDERYHNRHQHKEQCQLRADGERHDERTQHNERAAQQQTQRQVYAVLHLIDVTGHTRNQRRGADTVQLAVAQRIDMAVQILSQGRAEAQRRDAQPAQGLGHAAAAGQALRRQPRRRHIDARRGERDKHHVQRQNQLVKTHALAAQIRRQHDSEPHAQRPQHQPRPGKQRRIVQIIPAVVHTPPPSPADGYAEGAAGIPAREAFPLRGKVAAGQMRGDVIAATRYRAITESLPLISPLRGQLPPLGEAFSLRSILQSCANFGTLLQEHF